jgi:hypothetical protein
MPMQEEPWNTPLRCENGDSYKDEVLWKIHYVNEVTEPTNQVPEIRTLCRYCDAPSRLLTAGSPTHARGLRESGRGKA